MTTCNEHRIEQFLSEELPDADLQALETHLEQCQKCRRALESGVAEHSWWHEASDHLSDDEIDAEPLSTFIGRTTQNANEAEDRQRAREETQAAVRQFLKYLDATDDPHMLGRFGGYEIAGVIGAGGMSFVLKGFDAALNRYVAIKVLSPHLATSDAARQRFAREAQAAAAVVHDNVIAIHAVNGDGELPFLVMPYERGNSLQRRLDEQGPLELTEILRIGLQTAQGLAAAHAQGLVHRDVKPGNILLTNNVERVKLTDFGLARAVDDASLTRTGMIAGTPQYMSPEQARGEAVDQRSDLFSLGSVLYAMSTGRPPFQAESSYAVLVKITESAPTPTAQLNSTIPSWLCRIIDRLHAKVPDRRYANAEHVAGDLQQCLAHVQRPSDAPLPEWLRRSDRRTSRSPMVLFAVAFVVLVVALARSPFGEDQKTPEPNGEPEMQWVTGDPEEQGRAVDWDQTIESELQQIEQEVIELERETLWIDD